MSRPRQLLYLALILLLASGLLALTFNLTAPAIARAKQLHGAHLFTEALGATPYNNDLLATFITLTQQEAGLLNQPEGAKLYLAARDGIPQVMLIPITSRAGYGGPIELIVGVLMNGDITGVRALRHRETPGLGGNIELASGATWILNFQGKSIQLPTSAWRVKTAGGEFDQIAGATITSSAVIQAVYLAQRFFVENKTLLLSRFPEPVAASPNQFPFSVFQAGEK